VVEGDLVAPAGAGGLEPDATAAGCVAECVVVVDAGVDQVARVPVVAFGPSLGFRRLSLSSSETSPNWV